MCGRGGNYMYSVKQKKRERIRYRKMKCSIDKENENNLECYRFPELIFDRSVKDLEVQYITVHYAESLLLKKIARKNGPAPIYRQAK